MERLRRRASHARLHIRTTLRVLAATLGTWVLLAMIAQYFGALWPQPYPDIPTCFTLHPPYQYVPQNCQFISKTEAWENLLTFWLVVEFLVVKTVMMIVMTKKPDWLGSSVIAANFAFAAVYSVVMFLTLFPTSHGAEVRKYSRDLLVLVLAFGLCQIMLIPDPPPDEEEAEDYGEEDEEYPQTLSVAA